MDEYELDLSVVDVYDMASEIGKEFEKMIDAYGTESVTSLMPKVISALEHLESLAVRNERENTTVQDLSARITKLESEKIEKAEDRLRFERELEQIEDHWREESQDLVAMVSRLQEENRKLAERRMSVEEITSPTQAEVDLVVLQRLRATVDKQRETLRSRDKDLANKIQELDSLTTQVDRLTSIGKELRRKHKATQNQVRTLIDERGDFLAQLQDQQRQIVKLKQELGLVVKENEDLTSNVLEQPDMTNKTIYDLDDPNRPRFTTSELKEILQERNELKARVSDLEDELEVYKPRQKQDTSLSRLHTQLMNLSPSPTVAPHDKPPPHFSFITSLFHIPPIPPESYPLHAMEPVIRVSSPPVYSACAPHLPTVEPEGQDEEEDAPVQGPLPYEPDDAPWRKSESGIRKFFRKLFSENNVTFLGPSPKRSFSTLSKMALSTASSDTPV